MYVKLNFGTFAGEIRDIAPEAALQLLALGQATRAFEDSAPEPDLTLLPLESSVPATNQRKGRAK